MLTPTQYYILVEIKDVESESPIVRPDASGPSQPYGLVISCGPDCKFVEVGDKVCFLPQNMIGFENAKNLVIIPETSVFAKLELE